MIKTWDDLEFWSSDDWRKAQDKLNDLDICEYTLNPNREFIWNSLDTTPFEKTKVMFCGQDPYPDHQLATGLAFNIPPNAPYVPPTLRTLLTEWKEDLKPSYPEFHPNLRAWAEQGVLLWNVVPVCIAGKSLSCDWDEWKSLNMEIIQELDQKGCVFVFLGGVARRYAENVTPEDNGIIELSHPSPRASRAAKHPFLGSRLFSTINAKLVQQGLDPIDWQQ